MHFDCQIRDLDYRSLISKKNYIKLLDNQKRSIHHVFWCSMVLHVVVRKKPSNSLMVYHLSLFSSYDYFLGLPCSKGYVIDLCFTFFSSLILFVYNVWLEYTTIKVQQHKNSSKGPSGEAGYKISSTPAHLRASTVAVAERQAWESSSSSLFLPCGLMSFA